MADIPPPGDFRPVLHGLNAVAELKPLLATVPGLPGPRPPRLERRGRIEARRGAVRHPDRLGDVLHRLTAVAELEPVPFARCPGPARVLHGLNAVAELKPSWIKDLCPRQLKSSTA